MLLGPRVRSGSQGYNVVTPLIRADGSTVLVDRGFVLKDKVEKGLLPLQDGEVQLLGMLRTSQSRNSFTPDNHPEKGEWYWTDVQAMTEYAGGEQAGVQPVYIEEIFGKSIKLHGRVCFFTIKVIFPEGYAGEAGTRLSRGIPLGREATVDVRNSHLSYVATW